MVTDLTIIVIGKNEEVILDRCFSSINKITNNIIYVDSDSTDNSINIAKKYSASQAQVALNWIRSHGAKPIVGIRNPLQAKDAISALNWSLTHREKERLNSYRNKCLTHMPQNPFTSP